MAWTKEEKAEKIKAYREANAEKIKAYRKANAEKIKAQVKAYYEANAEKIKAYRKANAEKIKAQAKGYLERVAPGYVAAGLRSGGMPVTPETIELKRTRILISRAIKELKNVR